jgi:hypothetical protein
MEANQTRIKRIHVKKLLAAIGAGAFVVLGVLSLARGSDGIGTGSTLAGSGDAPTNTVYTQPTVPGASMGNTATQAPPASTLATSIAVPPLKAGS